jgi:hypothetical protein
MATVEMPQRRLNDNPNSSSISEAWTEKEPRFVYSPLMGFGLAIIQTRDMDKWSNKLDLMKRLVGGWDGYGAEAPTNQAIDLAHGYLSRCRRSQREPSRVAPSVIGGVGVTHKKNLRRVYVEFFNNGEIFALFSDNESSPISVAVRPYPAAFDELIRHAREYLDA